MLRALLFIASPGSEEPRDPAQWRAGRAAAHSRYPLCSRVTRGCAPAEAASPQHRTSAGPRLPIGRGEGAGRAPAEVMVTRIRPGRVQTWMAVKLGLALPVLRGREAGARAAVPWRANSGARDLPGGFCSPPTAVLRKHDCFDVLNALGCPVVITFVSMEIYLQLRFSSHLLYSFTPRSNASPFFRCPFIRDRLPGCWSSSTVRAPRLTWVLWSPLPAVPLASICSFR